MSRLEKAKAVIALFYDYARCGIFNTRNIVGDFMQTLFEEDGLRIQICLHYSYFEVFGLTDEEFMELERFYTKECKEGGEKDAKH